MTAPTTPGRVVGVVVQVQKSFVDLLPFLEEC